MAWSSLKMADAAMLAAVVDLESLGCKELEFRKSDPKWHRAGSYHAQKGFIGYYRAADMNRDGSGDVAERDWFKRYGYPIARDYGLSITAGINGYVKGHSVGDGMHMHIDIGPWSDLGGGVFKTTWQGNVGQPWPVRAFQKKHGLAVDGIAGKATISKLQELVGAGVDGIAGKETWSKVQRKVGSPADGIAGPDTFLRLGLAIQKGNL